MSRWWPLLALGGAGILALGWVPNAYFFMLEAWGERGEPKSTLFEVWAALTWIGWPASVIALVMAALVSASRARG